MQLINKEAIVQYLMKTRNEMQAGGNEYILGQKTGLATAVSIILSFPTVEERKQGHWNEENTQIFLASTSIGCYRGLVK